MGTKARRRLAAAASGLNAVPGSAASGPVAGTGPSLPAAPGYNRIDLVRVDAPKLARHGEFRVGVRTLRAVNPGQLDVVSTIAGSTDGGTGREVIYDRELVLECWYPAAEDASGSTVYEGVLMRDATPIQLSGIAVRNAEPLGSASGDTDGAGQHPLIIISHGYPGNRFLMSHLAENLATKGFVVVSIDHRDSTYDDMAAFGSTLLNRPLDQLFVLNHIATLSQQPATRHFLGGGFVDTCRTGIVGYSMGGYGATITSGGGVTQASIEKSQRPRLGTHLNGSREHVERFDGRIKAVLSFAPWGMTSNIWDDCALAAVRIPTMLVAGSNDMTSGYNDTPGKETGVPAMFVKMKGVERYLLTFANAVWDSVRMNNIAQHFATAWFGAKLSANKEERLLFENFLYSSCSSRDAEQEGQDQWHGFDSMGGKHPGLTLHKRTAGT